MNAPDKIREIGEIAIRGLIVNDEQTTKDELIQDVKRFIEHYQQKRKHFEDLVGCCDYIIERLLPLAEDGNDQKS